jgi:hypothetical protein
MDSIVSGRILHTWMPPSMPYDETPHFASSVGERKINKDLDNLPSHIQVKDMEPQLGDFGDLAVIINQRVGDILGAQAMPGGTGSNTFPQNLAPNVSQPSGRATPAASDSLATTTRVAQQNLKALVDGLASATHSLRSSPPQK